MSSRAHLLAILSISHLLLLSRPLYAFANNPPIAIEQIREAASSHFRRVDNISFTYIVTSTDGWKAKVAFSAKGNLFRVEREDIALSSASVPPSLPAELGDQLNEQNAAERALNCVHAFNGQRSQTLHRAERRMTLADGLTSDGYPVPLPAALLCGWVFEPGTQCRWDELRDVDTWKKRFETATFRASIVDNDMKMVVIDFPDPFKTKVPCFYRVSFAPHLGFAPMKSERLTAKGEQLSAVALVQKHIMVDVDGHKVMIPVALRYEQTDAGHLGLPLTMTFEMDESSLSVNGVIDDSVFTIPLSLADNVYDVDAENRKDSRQAASGDPSVVPQSTASSGAVIVVVNVLLVISIGLFVFYRRWKLKHG